MRINNCYPSGGSSNWHTLARLPAETLEYSWNKILPDKIDEQALVDSIARIVAYTRDR